jgi:hypothetical protein
MTKRRKVAKKKARANATAHRRAMAKPIVQERVEILKRRWATMGLLERGERLRELTGLGCSTRGLEKELGQSSTAIRRNIGLTKLPAEDRKAIEDGASAKKILERTADEAARKRRSERIILDRKTGSLSDGVATIILNFCRAEGGPLRTSVAGEDAEKLLNQVRWDLYKSDAAGYRVVWDSKRRGVKRLFNRTRPSQGKDAFWTGYQAEWLANIVWAIAPERPIWESALKKAELRISELTPKRKKPIEVYEDRMKHLAELSASPPPRKIYYGAKHHVERQGKPETIKNPRKAGS